MKILTNISKTELEYLTNQPTAKKLIEKINEDGIEIPSKELKKDTMEISNEGKQKLENLKNQENKIKEEIDRLKKDLEKIKKTIINNETEKKIKEEKINQIIGQITMLSMQLIHIQKNEK